MKRNQLRTLDRPEYELISMERKQEHTRELLRQFLDGDGRLLLLNEPVGFGKTSMLIEECLKPKNEPEQSYRRVVFLTYTNAKAVELENDFRERMKAMAHPPSLLRLFGDSYISEEKHYRKSGDIKKCKYPDDRRKAYTTQFKSAWSVCEKCDARQKCPYFRVSDQARRETHTILIGNLAELRNIGFYLGKKFGLSGVDLIVLDEDAVRKATWSLEIDEKLATYFLEYVGSYAEELAKRNAAKGEDTWRKQVHRIGNLRAAADELFMKTGLAVTDAHEPNIEELRNRNISPSATTFKSGVSYLETLAPKDQVKLFSSWNRALDAVSQLSFSANLTQAQDGKISVHLFPDLKRYKVIVADATTTEDELEARFAISKKETTVSYYPPLHGIIVPKGEVHQVLENISKSSLFNEGKLNRAKVKEILSAIRDYTTQLGFDPKNTWVITFKALAEEEFFKALCKKLGFKVAPSLYHGATRGINSIEKQDLVVIGSNFPTDKEAGVQQYATLNARVDHRYSDYFLLFQQDADGQITGLDWSQDIQTEFSDSWIKGRQKDFGRFGRKIYVENIIQSMRSRFFWYPTKTLLFSPYPLTDFGIGIHTLRRRLTQRQSPKEQYYFLKKHSKAGLTQSNVEKLLRKKLGKRGLSGLVQTFKRHKLDACVFEGELRFLNYEMYKDLHDTYIVPKRKRKISSGS